MNEETDIQELSLEEEIQLVNEQFDQLLVVLSNPDSTREDIISLVD